MMNKNDWRQVDVVQDRIGIFQAQDEAFVAVTGNNPNGEVLIIGNDLAQVVECAEGVAT